MTTVAHIVVIDDDEAARVSLDQMLRLRGFAVRTFAAAEAALAWPDLADADCVLCDVKMPGLGGEGFLARVRESGFTLPVVMITGHGDVAMAVRCLKAGAYDFIEKPFEDEVLLAAVSRAVQMRALRREGDELRRRLAGAGESGDGRYGLLGRSRAMLDLYERIESVARADAPVLIRGETGSGKELVARAIHDLSARASGPFVPVNAGALPDTVLESELFGHARGAFTGAVAARDGKLVSASGGTLLLDEVESIPVRAQVQLLRVLEDGLVFALGSDASRRVNIRLLAATKADLQSEVRAGRMREDFYHRIAVLTLDVPPLRDRRDDIPMLLAHFLARAATRNALATPSIPDATLAAALDYDWPGNVRELRNAAERLVITASGGVAGPLPVGDATDDDAPRLLSVPPGPGRLREQLERTEQATIEQALAETGGEVTSACRALGISRRALYERMKKYGLRREDYRDEG